MTRIVYRSPTYLSYNNIPTFKYLFIDQYNPSLKTVLIEVFYGILFSHHLPTLLKGGGILGNLHFINFSSIDLFLASYMGKIIFYILVFTILHFIIMPGIRKIDTKIKDLNKK
jgi:hypothetical protein|uniref:Uncharacterized protein n=1 Tax=viral metagenome TaxID=1070528 RepID=A0A6C0GZL6_9ZZZZ